jgi:hypothetical protein
VAVKPSARSRVLSCKVDHPLVGEGGLIVRWLLRLVAQDPEGVADEAYR